MDRKLLDELRELRANYSLCDKSAENIVRGQRIREITNELGIKGCQPRKNYRRAKVINR